MSHRYGEIVQVQMADEVLRVICWRGRAYQVVEILSTWHLRTRWWQQPPQAPAEHGAKRTQGLTQTPLQGTMRAALPPSDRHYFRLRCAPTLICELYFDAEPGQWVLDRVYD